MIKRKVFTSLRAKMFGSLVAAAVCAVVVFVVGLVIQTCYLNYYYLRDDITFQRNVNHLYTLQNYVQEHALKSTDTAGISEWTIREKYVYLLFYDEKDMFEFGAGWWGLDNEAPSDVVVDGQQLFPVYFEDKPMMVEIYDYSEYRIQEIWDAVLIVLSGMAFVLVMLVYSQMLTKRIMRLSKEVEQLGSNNLSGEITRRGNDEISGLAMDIDHMRSEILEQMKNEQMAVQANTDLITAISHDIRTPLTALLGYLDLAVEGQYDSEQTLKQYLHVSQEKALQLKSMTDELFQYFLVFGREELPMQMERYQAEILLEQILGEHCALLQMNGFRVKTILSPQGEICVDVKYLRRVFDNLFSNIEKYADRGKPVAVLVEQQDAQLRICICNAIPDQPNRTVSTKIGLKSARAILEQMHGKLLTTADRKRFVVEVVLPLVQEQPDQA